MRSQNADFMATTTLLWDFYYSEVKITQMQVLNQSLEIPDSCQQNYEG